MKYLPLAIFLLTAPPAFATVAPNVPEMDVGAGAAAIALVIGAAALIRERFFRKEP